MHSLVYIFIKIVTTVKYHGKVSFPGPHILLIKSEEIQGWIVQTAKETKSDLRLIQENRCYLK